MPVVSRTLRWLLLALMGPVACAHAAAVDVRESPEAARVLLLFSYHPGFSTSEPVRRVIARALGEHGVRVDVAYMDAKRHPDPVSRRMFAEAFAHKLAARPAYDLVIAADDIALDHAMNHRSAELGDAPLVFLGVNDVPRARELSGRTGITGVVEQVSIEETIALARTLDPRLRQVVALTDGTVSGRAMATSAMQAASRLDGVALRILSLEEHTWEEAGEELGRLGPGSVVLRLGVFRDRLGRTWSLERSMAHLARHAAVPVYVLHRTALIAGAVGGVVVDPARQAAVAADLALEILDGATAESLDVVMRSPNAALLDAPALLAHRIDPGRAPAGVNLLNVNLAGGRSAGSLFLLALVGVLSVALCVLLFKHLRRVKRDALERDREQRFRMLVENSVQGVLIHRQHVPFFANRACAEILGYDSPEELLGMGDSTRIYAPHERDRVRRYERARIDGELAPGQYEFDALRKDGEVVVLHTVVQLTTWNGRPATQHTLTDVTARARAQRMLRESEERYRTLVESATEALVVFDVDCNRIIDANTNAAALFDLSREALLEIDPHALSPATQPDGRCSREAAADAMQRALDGEQVRFEWTYCKPDGGDIPTEVCFVRLPSSDRELVRGSINDVSERLAARKALEEKSAQLEVTLENTDEGISMTDADLNVVAYNQRFLELLEFPPELFQQGDPQEKFFRYNAERGEYGPGDVDEQVRERLELAARCEPHRFVRSRPDGTVLEVRGQPLPGGGFVSTYTDITETHRLSEQLAHQARHDALTDLVNRREFEAQLTRLLENARRDDTGHAMCYLDLDQFKVINDTCGHMAGDELLRQLGDTLNSVVRKSDILARLGGDEFGVLLEDCTVRQAQRVATSLRTAVEDFRFSWEDKSFRLGASIGLVPVTGESGTVADVMSAADAACYAAKEHGRNRVHLFAEGDVTLADRRGEMNQVLRLQKALEEDRFCLMAQPIVPLGDEADPVDHFEILLRMHDESGAVIGPGQFLPAAERYSLMGRLDRWVVRNAFRTLATLQRPYSCSINLSGQSLGDDDFLEFIVEAFETSGVPARQVTFEVTETAAISNLSRATRFMTALRDIGCRFALDDFGSGLSSFGYLKTLPVDYLKIDGMFVKDILDDPIDLAMVRSINEIGHVMGKKTIAEFVENDGVRDRLRELGVDYAQGYGIGRPEPFPETVLLRRAS